TCRRGAGRSGVVPTRKLALTCRPLDADILALQEVDRFVVRSWFRDQPESIARALAHHHVATVAKQTPVGGAQCNAITSRGQFRDVETVELPRAEGQERRVALLARIALGGSDITVACTHLQHRGGGGRAQPAAVIVALTPR